MMNKLETVSIAEPLQNRQHARETPNAVNTRREREWEGEFVMIVFGTVSDFPYMIEVVCTD